MMLDTMQEVLEARRGKIVAATAKLPQHAEAALQQLADLRLSLVAAALVRIRELEDDVRAAYAAKRAALDVDLKATTDLAKQSTKLAGDAMQAVAVMGEVDVLTNAVRLRARLDALRAEVESTCARPVDDLTIEVRVPRDVVAVVSKVAEIVTGVSGLASADAVTLEGLPEDDEGRVSAGTTPLGFRVAVSPATRALSGYDAAATVSSIARSIAVSARLEDGSGGAAPVSVETLDPFPLEHCVSVRLRLPPGSPGGRVILGSVTVGGTDVAPVRGPPLPRLLATVGSHRPSVALVAGARGPLRYAVSTPCFVKLGTAEGSRKVVVTSDPETGDLVFVQPPQLRPGGGSDSEGGDESARAPLGDCPRLGDAAVERRVPLADLGFDGPVRACAWVPGEGGGGGTLLVAGAVGACSRIVALDASALTRRWETALGDLNGCFGVCALPSRGLVLASSGFDALIHVLALRDGSLVGRIDCAAGASGLRWPTFVAADDRSGTVFASVLGRDGAHCVGAWRWEEAAEAAQPAESTEGGAPAPPAGTWTALGLLEGALPPGTLAHPLAVVGAPPPQGPPPSSELPAPVSSLVVATLGSTELAVFALPDRRFSVRTAAPAAAGSGRAPQAAARAHVCGLGGDPGGAWLAVQDRAEGAVAMLPWLPEPLRGGGEEATPPSTSGGAAAGDTR